MSLSRFPPLFMRLPMLIDFRSQSPPSSTPSSARRRTRLPLSARPTTSTVRFLFLSPPSPFSLPISSSASQRTDTSPLPTDQKLTDDRAKRDEKYKAERRAKEDSKRAEINERLLEEAQAPAFEREIEDCRNLILFFQQRIGLAPSSFSSSSNGSLFARPEVKGVPKLEVRKVDASEAPKGTVLKKKAEQEEESWGGLSGGGKKGKKGGRKGAASPAPAPAAEGEDAVPAPAYAAAGEKLNLPLGTLTGLMSLGISAPVTTGEVQTTIESLELKKKYFTDNTVRLSAPLSSFSSRPSSDTNLLPPSLPPSLHLHRLQVRITAERVAAVEARIARALAKGKFADEIDEVAAAEPTEVEEAVKDAQPQPIEEGGNKEEAVENAEGTTENQATEEAPEEKEDKVEEEEKSEEKEE